MTPIRIFLVFLLLVLAVAPAIPYYCIKKSFEDLDVQLEDMQRRQEMEMQGIEVTEEEWQPEESFCSNCGVWSMLLIGYGSAGVFIWPLLVLCLSGKMSRRSLVVQTVIIGCLVLPVAVWEVLVFFF